MKVTLHIFFALSSFALYSQAPTPESLGYKHMVFQYKGENVDLLIASKRGEENNKKPLFFFCQGSMPQPLIKYDDQGPYGIFPFSKDSLENHYHVVIVGKPGVPLIAHKDELGANFMYFDSTGKIPTNYADNNLPDYYVNRNKAIIRFLRKQDWVAKDKLIVAGHSEGSTVAAKMAVEIPWVTHLIYAGGNPMGRIMAIVQRSRSFESDTDSTHFGEREFEYWERVVANKESLDASQGDTHKATYEFSSPAFDNLMKLKIPVLVCYGTKDWSAPFNDYLKVEAIRQNKTNLDFKAYIGTEHNFFPVKEDGTPNYEVFNWDKVADDWLHWVEEK